MQPISMRERVLLTILAVILIVLAVAWWITTQPFVTPIRSQFPMPDPDQLKLHVRALSMTFYPRSFDHPANLEGAGDYVRDALRASTQKVVEQEVRVGGSRYRNLVARFGPATGPLLVIGAHYDSYGGPDAHTPGADDNASGVAGLIELAGLMAARPPARPVELVAYTLEEPPNFRTENMGSAWHAKALKRADAAVELMLSLEMIGYFSDAPESQSFPFPFMRLFYPTTGNFIAIVSRLQDQRETRRLKASMAGASDLPVYSINTLPAIPGIDFSDHLNYWEQGYPAVMVTDTAYERNHAYHLEGDTFDRLDYVRMAKVVQGVYAFVSQR
jgi:Zn-dependent M28 family amino/carboxypeptidase